MSGRTGNSSPPEETELCTFLCNGQKISFWIRDQDEHIQRFVLTTAGFYEALFLEALSYLVPPGGTVIDAGANFGNHTIFFAKVMKARVHAFEPYPASFEHLERNVKINRVGSQVVLNALALGETQQDDLGMSVPGKDNLGMAHIVEAGTGEVDLKVTMTRLDSYLERLAAPPETVDLIKVDVEGYETALLRGAQNTIARFRPILGIETRRVEDFDEVAAILDAWKYVSIGTFNATPTGLYIPEERAEELCAKMLPVSNRLQRQAVQTAQKLHDLL